MKKKKLSAKKCHMALLRALAALQGEALKEVIGSMCSKSVNRVSELIQNLTTGEFPASKHTKKKLKKIVSHPSYVYVADATKPVHLRQKRLKNLTKHELGYLLKKAVPLLEALL